MSLEIKNDDPLWDTGDKLRIKSGLYAGLIGIVRSQERDKGRIALVVGIYDPAGSLAWNEIVWCEPDNLEALQ